MKSVLLHLKPAISVFVMLLVSLPLSSREIRVASPSGKIVMTLFYRDGNLCYDVTNAGNEIISPSVIDWTFDNGRKLDEVRSYRIRETYPTRGVHSEAVNRCNGKIIDTGGYLVEVRAFDDGVAWRYMAENSGKIEVEDNTCFALPEGTSVWSQPNIRHYEGPYSGKSSAELKTGEQCGCVVTVKYPCGLYATTSEAGVRDFAGMSFTVSAPRTYQATLSGECIVEGDVCTPWRVVITGDLDALVNSDIVSNVSEPARFPLDSEWIKPGRSVWSWLAWNSQVTPENMKLFSRQASELGFEYNLVDEGWSHWSQDGKDCWQLLEELVDYSDSLGVGIWVWKAYPDRKGIEGIYDEGKRREFFARCRDLGVKGVKIDFFDSEDQKIMKFHEDALADAAEYGLMVSFHGANKPTGLSRTFPNEMTRESIRGMENRPPWAPANTILPFTRMVVGPADFTPVVIPPVVPPENRNNRQEQRVGEVTITHHFATAAIYASPLLCYAVNPADLLQNPFREMLASIPPVWDETIVLPGSEIGRNVLFARRKGNEWYIAGVSLDGGEFEVDLGFLGRGKFTCREMSDKISSENRMDARLSEFEAGRRDVLRIRMDKAGGYLARFTPAGKS